MYMIYLSCISLHFISSFAGSVLYEIFNEPFGYKDPRRYLHEMLLVMHFAELPPGRCILDGCGYADNIQVLKS